MKFKSQHHNPAIRQERYINKVINTAVSRHIRTLEFEGAHPTAAYERSIALKLREIVPDLILSTRPCDLVRVALSKI